MADKESIEMATLRFGLIAPVINGTHKESSKMAYYRKCTAEPISMPDGTECRYSPSTLSYWECLYRAGGFDALMSKPRADKGTSRVLDEGVVVAVTKLRREFPKISSVLINEKLIEDGVINKKDISLSTIQRFVKNTTLDCPDDTTIKDRKAFEAEHALEMVQADTLYGPYITEDGKRRRAYLVMVIDDHSRLIVGGRFFYADNAANFQRVLKDVVSAYGVPKKLLVDNGSPYRNEQLSLICGSLGCVLIHAPVRDGATKGKIERAFGTLRMRFLSILDASTIRSLEELNGLLKDYIMKYNNTLHSAIQQTPMERYEADMDSVKRPKDSAWIDEQFLNRVSRKVRNDMTIVIDKVSYDVPAAFSAQKVELRFTPTDTTSVHILKDGKIWPLMATNKTDNYKTRRQSKYSISYTDQQEGEEGCSDTSTD
jgi:transposase InsO family protein